MELTAYGHDDLVAGWVILALVIGIMAFVG